MPKTAAKSEATVEDAMERLRQAAIDARNSADGADAAQKAVDHLNEMYAANKEAFTAEDVRFANVLRGEMAARLAAHAPKVARTKKAKRKGDKLDHCWRCKTPIDERYGDNCPQCSEKAYQWRTCPVCNACGCQRAGKVLI